MVEVVDDNGCETRCFGLFRAAGGRAITIPLSCHHVRGPDEGRAEAVEVEEKRDVEHEEEPGDDENEQNTKGGIVLELDDNKSESREDDGCADD